MSNEPDEVNSGALATTIVLVAFVTLFVALVVTALVRQTTAEVLAVKDLTQENDYRQLKATQLGGLMAAPAWTDRATGSVSVPIDQAMALVLEDVRKNPQNLSADTPEPEPSEDELAEDELAEDEAAEEELADGDAAEGEPADEGAAIKPSEPDAPVKNEAPVSPGKTPAQQPTPAQPTPEQPTVEH